MKRPKPHILFGGALAVLLLVGFTTIRNRELEIVKNLDIYYTLFRELNMFYVDETDPEDLVTRSIDAMLNSLDPYTTYIPESGMDDFKFQTTGEYGGIGSLIRRSGENVIIANPYKGFPADKAGLRAGDILLEVDGSPAGELPLDAVSDKLKGKPGTPLVLLIERFGEEKPLKFQLVREKISINNVPYYGMLDDQHTGYIRVSNFTSGAGKEVERAFRDLKQSHDPGSLVLDLRSNPGGLLLEAVRICNLFVEKGELIVSTKGKISRWDSDYHTPSDPLDTEIPLIVLVNRGSASASEIVAGALQDLDRAVIIGQRTFGKGLVQTTRPLKYNAQLKVTTAKYYIPSGRCIQALDYSNRNEDGSVGSIPDSLISEYFTRNGRAVYDGGGIVPDITMEPEKLSEITLQLYGQEMIFDFATRYRASHTSIPDPGSFYISNEQYEEFKSFVQERGFEFQTASEKSFQELMKNAVSEKYYELAKEEFSSLEKKLSHNNLKDLETFQEEIRQILSEEIISRYFYLEGRIMAQIRDDKQLHKAMEILERTARVEEILQPG